MHIALVLGIFAVTLLLIMVRPRGLAEAWFTCAGAAAMLMCGCVTRVQAMHSVASGASVLWFLLGLLIFSELLRSAGFFEWAALRAAHAAQGDGRVLYRNVFLLGAATTALLSLDTTAVILTPIVLVLVTRLGLSAPPFLLACAFVSNTGSLLLPVSNLTNLLFVHAFGWAFPSYVAHMLVPQILVLAANYALLRWLFRSQIPPRFHDDRLPDPNHGVADPIYFRTAVGVLAAVLVGYFLGQLAGAAPAVVVLSGCVLLGFVGICRRQVRAVDLLQGISWSVFPFVVGLFVVVRGVEGLGWVQQTARALTHLPAHSVAAVLAACAGAGVGSNVVNNIPMALLSVAALHTMPNDLRYAALLGCNLGPNLTVTGSLATMLVIASARRDGVQIGAGTFFRAGLVLTPLLLLVSALSLWLVVHAWR